MDLTLLQLRQIHRDWRTHIRDTVDQEHIEALWPIAQANLRARRPPFRDPPLVLRDSERFYRLVEGHYRLAALELGGIGSVECLVQPGNAHLALWLAAGSNREHCRGLSTADKQRAVLMILQDEELVAKYSNVQIGNQVGVDEATVRNWKKRLAEDSEIPRGTNGQASEPLTADQRRLNRVLKHLPLGINAAIGLGEERSGWTALVEAAVAGFRDDPDATEDEDVAEAIVRVLRWKAKKRATVAA